MYLNFSSDKYKNYVSKIKTVEYEDDVTSYDAFLILLNGLDYETVENLCISVCQAINDSNPLDIYNMIQNKKVSEEEKKLILDEAYKLIHSGQKLGNKIVNNHNTSSWITHSLFEGELACFFASKTGLNPDTARKLGLLHDIGRKFDQSFMHTIKGFEYLMEMGLLKEAFCTLTHSFLSMPKNGVYKGNRCANCDPAIPGFYVDKDGFGVIAEGNKVDDITKFLENYEYNLYDIVLNISDLMATSSGIVSPYERMLDVYTRKTPDKNSPFFKVCFINALNRLLHLISMDDSFYKEVNINDFDSLEEINNLLISTSTNFMELINQELKDKKISF